MLLRAKSLWYISSEAKDKFDTVIYVVNKTDQGVFSRSSASGTAELLYLASSPPTATPQTKSVAGPEEQHLREGSEAEGRAVPEDAQTQACPLSWGGHSQNNVTPFTVSPALADFRRLRSASCTT